MATAPLASPPSVARQLVDACTLSAEEAARFVNRLFFLTV